MKEFDKLTNPCTVCGMDSYDYNADMDVYVCQYCDSAYYVQDKEVKSVDTDELKRRRDALVDSLGVKYYNDSTFETLQYQRAMSAINSIQTLKSDDWFSKFFYAFLNKERDKASENYEKILRSVMQKKLGTIPSETLTFILGVAIEGLELNERDFVREMIEYHPEPQTAKSLQDSLEIKIKELEGQADQTALYERDVFICYSHKNLSTVKDIVNALEKEGLECWYSDRNIPENALNYKTDIQTAIKLCDVFLVIGSYDAMYSRNVQSEIRIAKELRKPRQEYKIDKAGHTRFFSSFFGEKHFAPQSIDASASHKFELLVDKILHLQEPNYSYEKPLKIDVEQSRVYDEFVTPKSSRQAYQETHVEDIEKIQAVKKLKTEFESWLESKPEMKTSKQATKLINEFFNKTLPNLKKNEMTADELFNFGKIQTTEIIEKIKLLHYINKIISAVDKHIHDDSIRHTLKNSLSKAATISEVNYIVRQHDMEAAINESQS